GFGHLKIASRPHLASANAFMIYCGNGSSNSSVTFSILQIPRIQRVRRIQRDENRKACASAGIRRPELSPGGKGTGDMTNPFLLSDDVLNDVMEALYHSITRVTADEMRTTPVADDWNKVQRWVADARTAVQEETQGDRASVPAFPINGPRLRSL